MKIAIMQPYFFPYIGYWQLINLVDLFVIYDDVNYIKRGWINRNRILLNGKVTYFNLPLQKASQNKLINEILVNKKEIGKNLNRIREAYKKAPYFDDIFPMVEEAYTSRESIVSKFIFDSFRSVCLCLGIQTKCIFSSDIKKENELRGEEKIIEICKQVKADEYINLPGGKGLYDKKNFKNNGIQLEFLMPNDVKYVQFGDEFESFLSIIDMLMFCGREETKEKLNNYEIKM